ncbi:HAD family hydrolase [Escherichia coli]|uniref:HAD family hydrolase n=1 Tax=Escherichia coli TaxID=562 RepID=UPI000BE155AD|nr:HAD-IB family phosphatase [Escherichia coli]
MKLKKIALFDLCETLVDFQTGDGFIYYVIDRLGICNNIKIQTLNRVASSLSIFKIEQIINKIRLGESLRKRILLYILKNIERDILNVMARDYVNEIILRRINPAIIKILNKHLKDGDEVIIISGGYDIYIQYLVKALEINGFVCTKIKFDNRGRCLGRISGKNCMGYNKVLMLKGVLSLDVSEYHITTYSDSISDLPILKMSNVGVVVSKGQAREWVRQHKLFEILI